MPKRRRAANMGDVLRIVWLRLKVFMKIREIVMLSACSKELESYLDDKKEWALQGLYKEHPKLNLITSAHWARCMDEYHLDDYDSSIIWPPNLTCFHLGMWDDLQCEDVKLPSSLRRIQWTRSQQPQWPIHLTHLTLRHFSAEKLTLHLPPNLIYLRIYLQTVDVTIETWPLKLEHLEVGYAGTIITNLVPLLSLTCLFVSIKRLGRPPTMEVCHMHDRWEVCNQSCKGPTDGSCRHSSRSRFLRD